MAGRDGAHRFLSAFAEAPGAGVSFSDMKVEVAASGDMGYTLTDAVVTVDGPNGQPIEERIRDFHLWTKENGDWKIAVDIWNAEAPPAGGAVDTPDPLADALIDLVIQGG